MSTRQPVASYEYRRADGTLLATKHRYVPKTFMWETRDAHGQPVTGLGGLSQRELPLYHLADILAAPPDALIYWNEGEKDADNIAALGLVGVSTSEGANGDPSKWPPEKLAPLRDRHVVLIPDKDSPGEKHVYSVLAALSGIASTVRILYLPGLQEKGDASDWLEAGGTREELERLANEAPVVAWKPEPVEPRSGSVLANAVCEAITRHVVLSDHASRALALWVLHTHAFDASEAFTPYIAVHSPTRAAGKTTLIDVLAALVAEPTRADSATAAAIYRKVDRGRGQGKPSGPPPTLFLDELDAVFSGGSAKNEKAEALRGVLNSGFKRDGTFTVCDGDNNEPRDFATFSAKCLAGIGSLPDTVADRSIPVLLARATRDELARIAPARHRTLAKLSALREELAAWARRAVPRLQAREEPLAGLSARQDDIWGPLLNLADECGEEWPRLAREAARALHAEKGDSTDGRDPGVALLSDLRDIFDADGTSYVQSAHLANRLRTMEDRPWPEYSHGLGITTSAIARLLRPYGIAPVQERVNGEKVRAYFRADCDEAFRRYLPPKPGHAGQPPAFPYEIGCPDSPQQRGAVAGARPGTTTVPSRLAVAVPAVPTAPASPKGTPPTWDPDPESLEPVPF